MNNGKRAICRYYSLLIGWICVICGEKHSNHQPDGKQESEEEHVSWRFPQDDVQGFPFPDACHARGGQDMEQQIDLRKKACVEFPLP